MYGCLWSCRGPHARRAAAKRSYPTSEVRGSGLEYQTVRAQEWPRGDTPCPRSVGAAKRRYPASEVRGGDERSYLVRGQGWWSGAVAGRRYPTPLSLRPGAAAGRTNPTSKEPCCAGAGGPRGAIPQWRSGRAVVRRYPSSKVRSNGCALLEQLWRDTPRPM